MYSDHQTGAVSAVEGVDVGSSLQENLNDIGLVTGRRGEDRHDEGTGGGKRGQAQ